MVETSRYTSDMHESCARQTILTLIIGRICGKGSREWWHIYRHQVQGWRSPRIRETGLLKVIEERGQQAHSDGG